MVRIFGDFNGIDGNGLIRLTSNGSRTDLAQHIDLKEGDRVVVYDYDLRAEARLERIQGEWCARVDRDTIQADGASVQLSSLELILLANAVNEVLNGPDAIEEWEFHTRLGVYRDTALDLQRKLSETIDGLDRLR